MAANQRAKLADCAIAFLGPQIEHRDSLRAMLGGRAKDLHCIPDSPTFRSAAGLPRLPKWSRLIDQLVGTRDHNYLDHVLGEIDRHDSRLVIGFWGTPPLPDLAAIKKARPHVKTVFMVLCYPLALAAGGIKRQNLFLRRAAPHLDGIIYSSREMADYFAGSALKRHHPNGVVIPPCWPASFFSDSRAQPVVDHPNLIYTGRPDLNGIGAQASDDVRPLMKSLLGAGIELHHGRSKELDDGHAQRRTFKSVTLPKLIEMISGYDASLIAYNTDAAPKTDRFDLTVFDRLITSVTAGVPIAIPRKGYAGAKSYLKDYPAVIEFDSAEELKSALSDRPRVHRLRDAAWNARKLYTAERQGEALNTFLSGLLS
jgi:hypothetical protein